MRTSQAWDLPRQGRGVGALGLCALVLATGCATVPAAPGSEGFYQQRAQRRELALFWGPSPVPATRRAPLEAGQSIKEIPAEDTMGDQLQAAARRISRNWGREQLSPEQAKAIAEAHKQGKYLEANLMERRFRGQWVERVLRREFTQLRWNARGVDAVDPATGGRYEVLSGTTSNMELHGRRLAETFFRLITF